MRLSLVIDERGWLVVCGSCGRRNRVPFGRRANCGTCHTPLGDLAEPVEVPSVPAFDALVGSSPVPVIVDFWAPWCGPCRMVAPELVKVAERHRSQWIVAKVNTDALPALGERYRVQSIPTMAVFSGGREIGRTSGARPAAGIEAFVAETVRGA